MSDWLVSSRPVSALSAALGALPTSDHLRTDTLGAVALSCLALAMPSSSSIDSGISTVGSHHLFTCRLGGQFHPLGVEVGSERDGDLGASLNVLLEQSGSLYGINILMCPSISLVVLCKSSAPLSHRTSQPLYIRRGFPVKT